MISGGRKSSPGKGRECVGSCCCWVACGLLDSFQVGWVEELGNQSCTVGRAKSKGPLFISPPFQVTPFQVGIRRKSRSSPRTLGYQLVKYYSNLAR